MTDVLSQKFSACLSCNTELEFGTRRRFSESTTTTTYRFGFEFLGVSVSIIWNYFLAQHHSYA